MGGADGCHVNAFPDEWSVPKFDAMVFRERSSRYCIGVPVLNEGERIRHQLRKMHDERLETDVVIADGGSTDGALEPTYVRDMGVRALLTKVGPGGLSAQLRMMFAWALIEGYDGVLTIDGNGKDGLEGLGVVQAALEDGFDFVQGSRFVAGGSEKNTPLDRRLALRLVHAPLLSLAAGFRYSDTTNGLRGWSRAALLDPSVAPFRDVFNAYELHYYLSIRLPRLGYRVTEVPARREYPDSGRTPTKIHGFRSKLDLIGQLAGAVMGRYDP